MHYYRISLYLFIFIHDYQWTIETPSFPLEIIWNRFPNFLVRLLFINIIVSDLPQNFNFTSNSTLFNPTNLCLGERNKQRWDVMWYFYNIFPFSFISPQHSFYLKGKPGHKTPIPQEGVVGQIKGEEIRGNIWSFIIVS